MKNRLLSILVFAATLVTLPASAGEHKTSSNGGLDIRLKNYVLATRAKNVVYAVQPYMESYSVDDAHRVLTLNVSTGFATQNFTEKSVGYYYKRLAKVLPKPYNRYKLCINTAGMPIEMLVPGAKLRNGSAPAGWGRIDYCDAPWVMNESQPHFVSHGLFDRHIALWQSHGIYYDQKKNKWKWQRPNLFGTNEDLFTQTIVVPYLIPMLERAGAVVYTPRERDWQRNEVIVDNDGQRGYVEDNGREKWRTTEERGFAFHRGMYRDGENPFEQGTARMVRTTKKNNESWASYQPTIPQSGRYAVYVSYQTIAKSVSDAQYIVVHKGERTLFRVNQQMGGGTWVYLGTFDFDAGNSAANRVIVTNSSAEKGVVTTDAVRFGGGMGNIQRGGATSGMPRCLEGARYSAQWSGAPYSVYAGKGGADDYIDDINTRSNIVNWLAGGSVYVPTHEGKKVPFELSLAVHSDAGATHVNDSIIGSLAICTTNFNDGRLAAGVSRQISHDFADMLLTGVQRDLTATYGKWTRRYLWDRNYSETRKPEVPSAIIETLSHQNFADMRRALDPNFRFTLARSLYKTILRYVNGNHSLACVVQPLPVSNFRIVRTADNQLQLSWLPVTDRLEPNAVPTTYNIYIAEGRNGFDNGRSVSSTSFTFTPKPNVVYQFRVTAVNRGGESFPSTTLAACVSAQAGARDVLVVDGFTRFAGPAVVDDGTRQGFDLDTDMGVSLGINAGFVGRQIDFDRTRAGSEGPGALGYCEDELAGKFFMGKQQNESVGHVADIALSGAYNVVSSSVEAVENGFVKLENYRVVDIMFGLQKDDGYSLVHYKTFSQSLRKALESYVRGNGRVFVSGAYVASDMQLDAERSFMSNLFKVGFGGQNTDIATNLVNGLGISFDIIRRPNDRHYAAQSVDVVSPLAPAFCAMRYADGTDAAVAYDGIDHKAFVMGFPVECINNVRSRQQVMKAVMTFLAK